MQLYVYVTNKIYKFIVLKILINNTFKCIFKALKKYKTLVINSKIVSVRSHLKELKYF